ncbi:MAG: PKD domain-containing protein [Bacteroidota bacterium]
MRPHLSSSRFFVLVACLVFCICSQPLHATHIVGGEMGYTCLGDNQYEIRLTIYRDCFFGNPNAYFDDPASIGVFDVNNVLLQDIRVPLIGDDTLSPVLTDECLVIPPDVCVHTTTYRTVVELLPRPGGYQLAYQRCCRNQTIQNIVEPLATGATYGVSISERALLECNSSAEFLQWPPLYICVNEPIIFDQSAIDADGDSIVYRLCTPLQGADPDIPRPQPPNNPPYEEVVWNDPPYNLDNMLNGMSGGVALTINSETGLLTGVPNTTGQFVVGICAEEYRDGELISTSRRDFQYNVGVCGSTTAAFLTPELQCDGLEVTAVNESLGTSDFLWIFGDPDNPLGTSTVLNPSFTFPDTGLYEITLIAAPGQVCADTFTQEIQLLPLTLNPSFSLDTLSCGDSLVLQINDLSVDELSTITSWQWSVNGEVFSTDQSPQLVITAQGDYTIELLLEAENGCNNATATALTDVTFIQEVLSADTLVICPGETINLNPIFIASLEYEWSPAGTLNDPTIPNPDATPEITTTYDLILTDPETGCTSDRQITVVVNEPLTVDLTSDLTTCEEDIELMASSNTGIRYIWSTEPDFSSGTQEGQNITVSPIGEETYYLLVLDDADCELIDSVTVNSQAVNLVLLTQDTGLCLGESLDLFVANVDPDDVLSWQWEPAEEIISGQGTPVPSVQPAVAGTQLYTVVAENQFGCIGIDTIAVTAVDVSDFGADLEINQCSGNTVNFVGNGSAANLYQWNFGDPTNPNASASGAMVSYTYPTPGTYTVQLSLPNYLDCTDTLELTVEVVEGGLIQPSFDWSYNSCDEKAEILFTNTSMATGTEIIGLQWFIGENSVGDVDEFIWLVKFTQDLPVTLITTAANGCVDTLQSAVPIELLEVNIADVNRICPGESAELNPSGNPEYVYNWSPGQTLSDSTAANPIASPSENTVYSVTVTDAAGNCQISKSVLVAITDPILYDLSPDVTTCETSVQIFAESAQDLDYVWASDSEFTQLLGTGETQLVNPEGMTVYYVQLTDENGCVEVDSIVVDNRAINAGLGPADNICIGDTLQLTVINFGDSPLTSYEWTPAASIVEGQGTSSVVVQPEMSETISVALTNDFGCMGELSVPVTVFQFQPALFITPEQDTLVPGESIQLMATDDPTYTYSWTPAIGLSATDIPNPVASPEETTLYELTIVDGNGCSNQEDVLLVVFNSPCIDPYIFVPNAFSPNGDNLNDVLLVEGNVIDEFYLAIYNRWGEQVFESFSQDDGWDGTFEGRALSPDVYGYYLEVSCFGGEEYRSRGNITLLR